MDRSQVRPLDSARKRGEGAPGPHEGVLGDIVGVGPADRVGGEAPDLGLAGPDRGPEQGGAVAVAGGEEERGQLVHRLRTLVGTSIRSESTTRT